MALILQLTSVLPEQESSSPPTHIRDIYHIDEVDLDEYTGICIGNVDQRFLAAREERLTGWVKAGGRLLINGHPQTNFVQGLPKFRKLDFHSPRDLWLSELGSHPIWDGIDRKDLLYRTGVPGDHSFAELEEIGVAGFYAHAYFVDLPEGATAITGIGQGQLPVDVAYPLGAGEVILHLGNDIFGGGMGQETVFTKRVIKHLTEVPARKAAML